MKNMEAGALGVPSNDDISDLINGMADQTRLLEVVNRAIHRLFRRKGDHDQREKTLLAVTSYFYAVRDGAGSDAEKLSGLKTFAIKTLKIMRQQRPEMAARATDDLPGGRRATDSSAPTQAADAAPVAVADLLDATLTVEAVERPTDIQIPAAMEARTYPTFRELLAAALHWRLSGVTRFFQRSHKELPRDLTRPFLLSADFEAKFFAAVADIIVPRMFTSRAIAMLEDSQNWSEVSSATFWAIIDTNEKARAALKAAWEEAWNLHRQREAVKQGPDGRTRRVLTALPELKLLRERLAPDAPGSYDLPPVRNAELDLFISMLDEFDVFRLDYCFNKLRQLYEQEMDRRWYQDKARQGALRDSLLEAIDAFPDRTGDFLALLCYYCFPNTDIFFLERFTHNKGANHAERQGRLPYLMRFLANERVPEVREREMQEKRAREEEAKREAARQRELERERQAQLLPPEASA